MKVSDAKKESDWGERKLCRALGGVLLGASGKSLVYAWSNIYRQDGGVMNSIWGFGVEGLRNLGTYTYRYKTQRLSKMTM
jgi:hypothetical protein